MELFQISKMLNINDLQEILFRKWSKDRINHDSFRLSINYRNIA